VAAVVPKLTAVAPRKSVPVMVTLVPPVSGPLLGLTAVTAGAASGAPGSRSASSGELEVGRVEHEGHAGGRLLDLPDVRVGVRVRVELHSARARARSWFTS